MKNNYGTPIKQVLVKYPDCNATTFLFGGKLLSWIDEGAAIFASHHMQEDLVVTAHFGGLDFEVPVELRQIVTIYAKVEREGNTSLSVICTATKRSMGSQEETRVAQTKLVFVAVDENMKKKIWGK